MALNEGRGANPGDTTSRRGGDARRPTLNEGRGANPGDTRPPSGSLLGRKALNEGRGANPGDTHAATAPTPRPAAAQRRPGREPRRHAAGCPTAGRRPARSTKAGARTPATRVRPRRRRAGWSALNEGRGANPGDTPPDDGGGGMPPAQRRPGREPRRHPRRPTATALPSRHAQRRPGREPRRH